MHNRKHSPISSDRAIMTAGARVPSPQNKLQKSQSQIAKRPSLPAIFRPIFVLSKINSMFSRISWQQFITTLFFLLWVYYTAIIILFYRKDILKWFTHGVQSNSLSKKATDSNAVQQEAGKSSALSTKLSPMSYHEVTAPALEEPLKKRTEAKINYAIVHELMDELKTIFTNAAEKKIIRQELVFAIQNKLKDYSQFRGTEIEHGITQHIENECKETCAIDLGKEDTQSLWKS